MGRRRSAEEIAALVKGYLDSGATRSEYCRRVGIAVGTLDNYRRRQSQGQGQGGLVRVTLERATAPEIGFTLVLGNGRRIESGWKFGDAELARLIRVAEAV
jgi:transposase-like protein